jgi:hypothetical protein
MDSPPRSPHAADLRRKLAELTAEVLKTEDELVALESEGQLKQSRTDAMSALKRDEAREERITMEISRTVKVAKKWPSTFF